MTDTFPFSCLQCKLLQNLNRPFFSLLQTDLSLWKKTCLDLQLDPMQNQVFQIQWSLFGKENILISLHSYSIASQHKPQKESKRLQHKTFSSWKRRDCTSSYSTRKPHSLVAKHVSWYLGVWSAFQINDLDLLLLLSASV